MSTANCERDPAKMLDFCSLCGQMNLRSCPDCKKRIRGYYERPNVSGGYTPIPAFCHSCGKPFPWTVRKLIAMQEMADEMDELLPEEKERLKNTFKDLMTDTPSTEVAAVRFKKLLAKGGKVVGEILYKMTVDIASEAGKKCLMGS